MSAPRVSVLMTTHNGARTIGESIASVLAQVCRDFELVIVDDCSNDGTPDIIARFTDSRIVATRNDVRLGIVGARNTGISRCRARYIAMLDHDDLSDPERLHLQAEHLDGNRGTVLVATALRELRGTLMRDEDQPKRTTPALLRLLLHVDNPLAWSSVMVRADALRALGDGPLRSEFEPADDFDAYHRLLALGDIARVDLPLTTYRWHAGNTTHLTADRIASGAAEILARAYAPWFGDQALAAARLIVRHGNHRVPICDSATLARVRAIVRRIAGGLGADRADVARVLWRMTRAAVRSGRPWLMRPPAPWTDAAVSCVVGAARAVRVRRGR